MTDTQRDARLWQTLLACVADNRVVVDVLHAPETDMPQDEYLHRPPETEEELIAAIDAFAGGATSWRRT